MFAALGDETRLRIVETLSDGGPRSIAQLTSGASITRQAMAKHLRVLEEAGLVRSARHGRENVYALRPEPIAEARASLEKISAQWDDALARLRAFVED